MFCVSQAYKHLKWCDACLKVYRVRNGQHMVRVTQFYCNLGSVIQFSR